MPHDSNGLEFVPLRHTVGHHHEGGEENHLVNTGALVGHIEAYTVVRTREVGMKQVNAGQPTVVMADDGRTLAVMRFVTSFQIHASVT